ncbi:MAG TPA: LacI family DNA-binding transcriptional regulator [Mobilitalea sp.]|nr:LacI family DNA-binding transcriptional regulator [Mobilitalea sp.]
MTTIKDIAREAGVSIATVSKVLNNKQKISSETADKVLSIAKALNYNPNVHARNLKNGQNRTIGIITEDLTVFNSPSIVDGIAEYCENNQYHYILGNLRFNRLYGHSIEFTQEKSELVTTAINNMLSKQVDGIIYVGCHSHEISHLTQQEMTPFVCAYCFTNNPGLPSVIYDDQTAAYDATKLLIDYGHRKIGVISGLANSIHSSNRLFGYQDALYQSGIPYNPRLILYGNWEKESGYDLCQKLIADGVTAIFAHNDLMAIGVIEYCIEHNITIGQELSLIGFDNRDISMVCRPKLTTVSLPLYEIGHQAAELLINLIENKPNPESQIVKLECEIIERESVKKLV